MIIFDNVLDSHAPDCFDSDFWTGCIVVLFNLMRVCVSTNCSQVTNLSAVGTCGSLEFAICFLVLPFHNTHVSDARLLPFPLPLPEPFPVPSALGDRLFFVYLCFHFCTPLPNVLVCHTSCTSRLCTNTHFSCESSFRSSGMSECLATPSVLSTSGGSSSSGWPCRDNPLIVNCSSAYELSDPCGSFETFLTQSRHASSNNFSLGQLYWEHCCDTRRTGVSTKPFSQPGPSPCMLHSSCCLHARSLWLVRQCLPQAPRTAPSAHSLSRV